MFISTSWTKNYDQDLKKNVKIETKVHYLSIETNISSTRHEQHFEIHFEFRPWDGRQMVNIEYLILYYGLKSRLKWNKIITIFFCSFRSTYN
jgi:hypothetical protein